MQKNKKTKSHGKPSVNKKTYNESAKSIGIDIETYGPRRPKPVMVYKIYCHYKKTLDHSKYTWARWEKFAEDAYKYRMDSDNICNRLETQYPNWYFSSVSEFVDPSVPILTGTGIINNIIYNIQSHEIELQEKLKLNNKINTDAHKKQILKDAGIEDEEEIKTPKKKTKKTKKL